jgi:hypothetical protein
MSGGQGPEYEGYVAAYDAAQRLHARLAAEAAEAARQAELYAGRGRALYEIKELARAGFLLLPGASDEGFERLWRKAFQVEEPAREAIRDER